MEPVVLKGRDLHGSNLSKWAFMSITQSICKYNKYIYYLFGNWLSLQSFRLIDKWVIKWSQTCMDILPWCMFSRLRLYFVKILYLMDLTCPVADHVRRGDYATTYVDK